MLRVGIMTKGLPMRRRGILRGLLAGRCADGERLVVLLVGLRIGSPHPEPRIAAVS